MSQSPPGQTPRYGSWEGMKESGESWEGLHGTDLTWEELIWMPLGARERGVPVTAHLFREGQEEGGDYDEWQGTLWRWLYWRGRKLQMRRVVRQAKRIPSRARVRR